MTPVYSGRGYRWRRRARRAAQLVLSTVALMILLSWAGAQPTSAAVGAPVAAASTTSGRAVQTLSVASPSPLPRGDVDGDDNDWRGAPWMPLALIAVAVPIATILILRLRARRPRKHRP
jgi:hypothetical protein